jgi:hypothetical protein
LQQEQQTDPCTCEDQKQHQQDTPAVHTTLIAHTVLFTAAFSKMSTPDLTLPCECKSPPSLDWRAAQPAHCSCNSRRSGPKDATGNQEYRQLHLVLPSSRLDCVCTLRWQHISPDKPYIVATELVSSFQFAQPISPQLATPLCSLAANPKIGVRSACCAVLCCAVLCLFLSSNLPVARGQPSLIRNLKVRLQGCMCPVFHRPSRQICVFDSLNSRVTSRANGKLAACAVLQAPTHAKWHSMTARRPPCLCRRVLLW